MRQLTAMYAVTTLIHLAYLSHIEAPLHHDYSPSVWVNS